MNPGHRRKPEDEARILADIKQAYAMRQAGATYIAIAKAIRCSDDTAAERVRQGVRAAETGDWSCRCRCRYCYGGRSKPLADRFPPGSTFRMGPGITSKSDLDGLPAASSPTAVDVVLVAAPRMVWLEGTCNIR